MKKLQKLLSALILCLTLATAAHADVVYSIASAGSDANFSYWDLTYTVTNTTGTAADEINLYFDAANYPFITANSKGGWTTGSFDSVYASGSPFPSTATVPYDYYFYNAVATGSGIAASGGVETFSINVTYNGEPNLVMQNQVYDLRNSGTIISSNLTQASTVPEPTTYALLAMSLGVIALARRKMNVSA